MQKSSMFNSTIVWHRTSQKVKNLSKRMPHDLNEKQQNRSCEVSPSLILCKKWLISNWIVTCNEKWILHDNRKRLAEWLNHMKALGRFQGHLCMWRRLKWLYSFLKPGETINAEKFCQETDTMHRKLQLLHPTLINRGPRLQDNARQHVAQLTLKKFKQLCYEILPYTPHSPDLRPPLEKEMLQQ